jgi:hypothetical protein
MSWSRVAAAQPSIDAGDAEIIDDMNKISRAAVTN